MADAGGAASQRVVWGVCGLLRAVSDALASRFAACTVRGELSGFTRAASGHCYLSLKDADEGSAMIRCAMFRRAAVLLAFEPADGQLVELRGRLAVYEARGELQFIVEAMQPVGEGALFEQFLRLKVRLEAEGLFDAARKRPLPAFPRAVGVVTSPGAAALHDVLSALARRAAHVRVVLYPSLVQGPEAPASLLRAIALANQRAEVDSLIVCRGGGSLEDLWAFNDERVVRAIAASAIPVVCGVGHETDVSLSDFAADLRAPTPTAAAELVAPRMAACLEVLAGFGARLARRVRHVLDMQAQRLDAATLRLTRPLDGVRRQEQRLALLEQRLLAALPRALSQGTQRLERSASRLLRAGAQQRARGGEQLRSLGARLDSTDPSRVLARGYAWLTDAAGQPVASAQALTVDQSIRAVLFDGEARARITEVRRRRQ